MPDLVVTYGGPNDNSYVTLEDADEMILNGGILLYHSAWDAAVAANADETRQTALMMATNLFQGITWRGGKVFYTQMLAFPRIDPSWVYTWSYSGYSPYSTPDQAYYNYLATSDEPRQMQDRIRKACVLTASSLLESGGEQPLRDIYYSGRGGFARGHKFSESASFREAPSLIPPQAWDLMRKYRATGPRIERG